MDLQQKTRRFGAWVIFCSLLLRLYALGAVDYVTHQLLQPNMAALLIYLETGRIVRFSVSPHTHEAESSAPWAPPEPLPTETTRAIRRAIPNIAKTRTSP